MKILLVQSFLDGDTLPPVYPLGLSYLATFLKGHEVRIYDPNVAERPMEDLIASLSGFVPDLVGVSLRNIDNQSRMDPLNYYGDFRAIVQAARRRLPSVVIVAGGTGFSMFAREVMEGNPEIDFGVHLEAEESFPELLNNLSTPGRVRGVYYREDGAVRFTGVRPLPAFGEFPRPRRDLAEMGRYTGNAAVGIQTKRGCPLKCTYCNYPVLNGNKIRMRTASHVVDEIEALVREGAKQFMFADSVFNRPEKHAAEICNEMIKRDVRAGWMAYLDIKGSTREVLLLMKEAGCNGIFFSPDGLSQSSLDSLRKGIREKDAWRILWIIATEPGLKEVEFIITMFINTPGETPFGMLRMFGYKVVSVLMKIFLKRRVYVTIGWIRIEPETGIHAVAVDQGVIPPDTPLLQKGREEIRRFFYVKPSLRRLDGFVLAARNLMRSIRGKRKK
ncbi:MAG: cobalamin-dependent protein [Alphaproteobacteria bacterium]|uniref:Cobalamin-dependent protein n=1 Tax=Candidatus Nitrobium versatile TaxID=2884831 RepID=A0A953M3S0_9BACT|nr:cobalamin-dependent protein [Candidatus Nitrobium versatile]